jgi:hypothetical protein
VNLGQNTQLPDMLLKRRDEVVKEEATEKVSVSNEKSSSVKKKVDEIETSKVAVDKKQQVVSGTNENKCKKPRIEEKLEEYAPSNDYAVWLPPKGNTFQIVLSKLLFL